MIEKMAKAISICQQNADPFQDWNKYYKESAKACLKALSDELDEGALLRSAKQLHEWFGHDNWDQGKELFIKEARDILSVYFEALQEPPPEMTHEEALMLVRGVELARPYNPPKEVE